MQRCSWWARAGLLGCLITSQVLIGCGSGDGKASGPTSFAGEQTSQLITAAEGGTMEIGAVKVQFPAGALDADETIMLEVKDKKGQPDAANVAIDVYEFGPSMSFMKPVELEFDLEGVRVPSGKRAVMAVLDEETNSWKKLGDSSESAGKIKGSTLHFSTFTVVFVLSPGAGQVGGQCGENFSPCGGDLVGTWNFSGSCADLPLEALFGSGSPLLECSEPATATFSVRIEGVVTFSADGSMDVNRTSDMSATVIVPFSCIREAGPGAEPEEVCVSEIEGTSEGDACRVELGEGEQTETSGGTYRTEGGILYIDEMASPGTDTGDEAIRVEPSEPAPLVRKQSESTELEYCVQGNTVTVRETDTDGTVIQYTATRQ